MKMSDSQAPNPIQGKRVGFVGKMGGMNKRELQRLVSSNGGFLASPDDVQNGDVDLVVIGVEQWPPASVDDLLSDTTQSLAASGTIQIINETLLWQQLGMVDDELNIRRLYTPAMLAELLDVEIGVIRRWHRRGLIVPAREVHKLPYFDFQEVATAQRIAEMLAAGASVKQIEKSLAELARYVPDVERPLAQLSVIVEGQQILLRQGEGLVEPSGQMRMDFDALEDDDTEKFVIQIRDEDIDKTESAEPVVLPFERSVSLATAPNTPEQILSEAAALEDDGELDQALQQYRTALMMAGPHAEINFRIAELLYRKGDFTAARERYFMAIELDENYVEARANLGCVLLESGEEELAIAALYGALKFHPDYPDAHYHLAKCLDKLGRRDEATDHWRAFIVLAPDSPWAAQARDRLMQ